MGMEAGTVKEDTGLAAKIAAKMKEFDKEYDPTDPVASNFIDAIAAAVVEYIQEAAVVTGVTEGSGTGAVE